MLRDSKITRTGKPLLPRTWARFRRSKKKGLAKMIASRKRASVQKRWRVA